VQRLHSLVIASAQLQQGQQCDTEAFECVAVRCCKPTCAVQCSAVQCSAVQCSAVRCSAVRCMLAFTESSALATAAEQHTAPTCCSNTLVKPQLRKLRCFILPCTMSALKWVSTKPSPSMLKLSGSIWSTCMFVYAALQGTALKLQVSCTIRARMAMNLDNY
jgi:hypothetical protein